MGIRTLVLMVVAAVVPSVAWAQATLGGTVKDAGGAVLPGVVVEAKSAAPSDKIKTTVTNADGKYTIDSLQPGTYSLTLTIPAFSTLLLDNIQVAASDVATVDATLTIGRIEETRRIPFCGMTVLQGDRTLDPKMPQHPAANAPKPTIRIVKPQICGR